MQICILSSLFQIKTRSQPSQPAAFPVEKDLINKYHLQYGGINRILLWHPKIRNSQEFRNLPIVRLSVNFQNCNPITLLLFFPNDEAETIIPEIFFPGGTLEDP